MFYNLKARYELLRRAIINVATTCGPTHYVCFCVDNKICLYCKKKHAFHNSKYKDADLLHHEYL